MPGADPSLTSILNNFYYIASINNGFDVSALTGWDGSDACAMYGVTCVSVYTGASRPYVQEIVSISIPGALVQPYSGARLPAGGGLIENFGYITTLQHLDLSGNFLMVRPLACC